MKPILALLAAWMVAAVPAWAEIEIEDVTSPGGVHAWLVEEHSIPFVALEIRFRGGTSLDAEGKRGAVNLMTGLIEEGAGDMDARAFARAQESLAASFSFGAGDDSVSVSAQFLTENRDQAAALLRDTLHAPRFDPDAIERVRAQVVSGLLSDAKDPNDIAGSAFSELAFGTHPYGSDGKGTVESVTALTRDDILAAKDAVFARDRLYVGAVGDITAEELGALVDQLLADLPETGAPIPGPAELGLDGGVTVIEFDTPQSVALFGQRGIAQEDDDFFAAYVLNQILGGGSFESRLMTEVREKRGLTYGIYTYLAPGDFGALYMGRFSSANGRVAEALGILREEWARMAEEGVTEAELEDAKRYLTGAYPLRFDGNERIADQLLGLQTAGLDIDYVNERNDLVEAVTREDIARVARRILDPDRLTFVVVGRPEGVQATN